MRVTQLDISAAAFSCLQAIGITDIEDFRQYPCDELLYSPHLGAAEIYEVVKQLNQHGLTLPRAPGGRLRLPSPPKDKILRLRLLDGLTFAEIGEHVGLGKERVRQVLRSHYGLSIQPPAVGARRRRETIERIWTS